jgi:Holliday junction resolvasome RuvABC endonuclease subunit
LNILGIDLSIRATGLAMLCFGDTRDSLDRIQLPGRKYVCQENQGFRYHGALAVRTAKEQLAAWEDILLPILTWAMHAHQVIIEEYSHGSVSSSMDIVHELGGIVKYSLRKIGQVPIEISPKSVKKFVTGNGNADKDMMLACVQKAGLPILDHNMADAFGLARFGYALQQPDSVNAALHHTEREAIHAVKYPKVKVRPAKEPKLWEAT